MVKTGNSENGGETLVIYNFVKPTFYAESYVLYNVDNILTTANSSLSNIPSLSTSDKSHTLPSTSKCSLEFKRT